MLNLASFHKHTQINWEGCAMHIQYHNICIFCVYSKNAFLCKLILSFIAEYTTAPFCRWSYLRYCRQTGMISSPSWVSQRRMMGCWFWVNMCLGLSEPYPLPITIGGRQQGSGAVCERVKRIYLRLTCTHTLFKIYTQHLTTFI